MNLCDEYDSMINGSLRKASIKLIWVKDKVLLSRFGVGSIEIVRSGLSPRDR
jgi:hypothetical protein